MDAIILAAGRGDRLEGIAAPFHKPLLVVNGKPLIVQAVDQAAAVIDGEVTVVVAPENAAPISHVLGCRQVNMVVQRFPDGPGGALLDGLKTTAEEYVLVLMADNVLHPSDITACVEAQVPCVGVRQMTPEEAGRFTYLGAEGWVEGAPIQEADVKGGWVTVWCGPLVLPVDRTVRTLSHRRSPNRELKIGEWLTPILDGYEWVMVNCDVIDIGVPEAIS